MPASDHCQVGARLAVVGRVRQFHGGEGVPLRVEFEPQSALDAWASHRGRLGSWLDSVPDAQWGGPTRCDLWDATALVRHLASGSQFLGYTLHKSRQGVATSLLQGFDPQETPDASAELLGALTPGEARDLLKAMDARVEVELTHGLADGWPVLAEAPPGNVPAHVAVSHFLFDSWVHEFDLMLPRGERPALDEAEVQVVLGYLMGLASLMTESSTALDVRPVDLPIRIGVSSDNGFVRVSLGSAPSRASVIEGPVLEIADRTTARGGRQLRGDAPGLAVLDDFGRLMAGDTAGPPAESHSTP